MRFVGPVLVRTTPSYHVLSLPGACCLYIGESLQTEIPRFLADWRARNREETWWLSGKFDTEQDRALQAIEAVKQDPEAAIRRLAPELEGALRSEMDRRRQEGAQKAPNR